MKFATCANRDAAIYVAGSGPINLASLTVNGTQANPVTFTSLRDDSVGGDTNGDGAATVPLPGDWQAILFDQHSTGSLNYAAIRYGGSAYNGYDGAIHAASNASVALTNSAFSHNTKAARINAAGSLTAFGNTATSSGQALHISGTIANSRTWQETGLPYVVDCSFSVQVTGGGSLTIDPGVVVKFATCANKDAGIYVAGGGPINLASLTVNGTQANPVTFTSLRDDSVGGDTNGDGAATVPMPGDWQAILFDQYSTGSLSYAAIRYGGSAYNGYDGALDLRNGAPSVALLNNTITDNANAGLHIGNGVDIPVTGHIFNRNATAILVDAAQPTFHQNQIAGNQFGLQKSNGSTVDASYNWWGAPNGPSGAGAGLGDPISANVLYLPYLTNPSDPPAPPQLPVGFTVQSDRAVYPGGQPVAISGVLTASGAQGISNAPVIIQITSGGSTRVLSAMTGANGAYGAVFTPLLNEAGAFQIAASASSAGVTLTANTNFRVLGLVLSPASANVDQVAGTSQEVSLSVRNVGDASLANLNFTVTSNGPATVTATLGQAPGALLPGEVVPLTLTVSSTSATPPPTPVTFTVHVTGLDSLSPTQDVELAAVTVTFYTPVSSPVLIPSTATVGVENGHTVVQSFAVRNDGHVAMTGALVTLDNPAAFNWVVIGNGSLGTINPGQSKQFQISLSPPASLPVNTYQVPFTVTGGSAPVQGTLTVHVGSEATGAVSFVVNDDTGSKVSGAAVSLINKANDQTFQGATDENGLVTLSGVTPGDYDYTVGAEAHDPAVGSVKVMGGATAGPVSVLLSYNVVSLTFSVTPTTIVDQYNITLRITYATTLPKPALRVLPTYLPLSFFPQQPYQGTLQITNTHPTANIRNLTVDSSQLDLAAPSGEKLRITFSNGTSLYSLEALAGKESIQLPFTATVDPNYLETRGAGDIVVQGNYDYTLDGLLQEGTTRTTVAVFFTRPTDLATEPIHVLNDETDGNLNDLQYARSELRARRHQQPDSRGRAAETGNGSLWHKEPGRVYRGFRRHRRACHDQCQCRRRVLALRLCAAEGQSDRSGRPRHDRRVVRGRPEQQLAPECADQPVDLQSHAVPDRAQLGGSCRSMGGPFLAGRLPRSYRRLHDSRRGGFDFQSSRGVGCGRGWGLAFSGRWRWYGRRCRRRPEPGLWAMWRCAVAAEWRDRHRDRPDPSSRAAGVQRPFGHRPTSDADECDRAGQYSRLAGP